MPLGLTFYFKWPCLERFLVENKNPRETSGLENGVENGAISISKWSKILLIVMGFTNTFGPDLLSLIALPWEVPGRKRESRRNFRLPLLSQWVGTEFWRAGWTVGKRSSQCERRSWKVHLEKEHYLLTKVLFTHRWRRQNFRPSLLQQWITV